MTKIARCRFYQSEKLYDYRAPPAAQVGERWTVPGRRGVATVEIMEITDTTAVPEEHLKSLLRPAEAAEKERS